MALSQIQCLDEHHVNWRVSESKPEFFYSEDQRLALEALINGGHKAFTKFLCDNDHRHFLSEPEIDRLARTVETYRPGSENLKAEPGATSPREYDGGEGPLSLQYWPDRSEGSIPDLDLGWPDAASYRGVTRVNVHMQPPVDGQTHIKEVVRKSIAQAQKVIAVVMDQFSDIDIYKDLLDAAYRRRLPVYIIIDTAAVSCFLNMCSRAKMHKGHLKNLRVRCSEGVEFYTRSAQKVRGSLSQRYMLIDGDKALTGSYSFTWSASRLDRNLITVLSGQAVETFDKQFRDLYMTSRGVSLAKVQLEEEPIADPTPTAAPAPISADVARKLINPKYALVTAQAKANKASPSSSANDSSNKNSTTPNPPGRILKRGREPAEPQPLHPGLANLEKAYLISYLPTWPEPDPASDVIGFINVRDASRPQQVHLQRSQQFETSQAIRFSSPFTVPDKPDNTVHTKTTPILQNAIPQTRDTLSDSPQTGDTLSDSPQTRDTLSDSPEQIQENAPQPLDPPTHIETETTNPPKGNIQTPIKSLVTNDHTPKYTCTPPRSAKTPSAPPIPKPRTLKLLMSPSHSHQSGQPQVSLIPSINSQLGTPPASINQSDTQTDNNSHLRVEEEERPENMARRSLCVNHNCSHDNTNSTLAIYDQTPNGSDDTYDTSPPLANGGTAGSELEADGVRHGDGVNIIARLSQSMLDLRCCSQSDDRGVLANQSQDCSSCQQPRPHQNRHIEQSIGSPGQGSPGQVSPGLDRRQRGRVKVVIAKPGSFYRLPRASVTVIGGHRYWHGQSLQPSETRSSRTIQRPAERWAGSLPCDVTTRRSCDWPGGVSSSKLSNTLHRALVGASQKKIHLTNKKAS
ncbi:hypothetical protein DPEC_G00168260 [Dallia pectoralis]|uniref:Uncharacterized protein n=1 Tax=Dallia pectoralis TaxID=75939 RepID=A0ACC2GCD4_DALPE|nr:hypothetical protein DPEC_G00168260 [Dallia pectoralis]